MPRRILIAPSLLSADFSRLDREIASVEAGGADLLHVDVMDGHFVPNITIGPFIVEAIKRVSTLPLDVHLMITDPEKYLDRFIDAGSDWIDFHVETVAEPMALIERLHSRGVKAGISINPETEIGAIEPVIASVDQVMVMMVNPGFGGQKLIPECVEKVRALAGKLAQRVNIEVDGGTSDETVGETAGAGANVFVAGTAIFGRPDRAAAIARMRGLAEAARRDHNGSSRR